MKSLVKANKYKLPTLKIYTEFEYINIERKTLGVENDFAEATTVWTTVGTNIRASKFPTGQITSEQLTMFEQGLIKLSSHWMMVTAGVSIQSKDRMLDENNQYFEILESTNFRSHREALLRIVEGS